MNAKLKLVFNVFILVLFTTCSALKAQEKEKPNILFILADDLTRWDVGCYGSIDSKTPTIDSLAASGMKFNKCYQAAPMCSPTRHNLLTGMYPVRTGAYPNHTYAKEGTQSVVQYLKPLGYRVALSGKRHILPENVFPFEYIDGNSKTTTDPDLDKIDLFLEDVSVTKNKFCLFVNFKSPHSPWTEGNPDQFDIDKITLPPYIADTPETRNQFRNYLAEINYLDGQIRQTLNLIKKHGFGKNTLVMFATEQGNSFPFAKWTLYNAGVGSGLIVNWPGHIKPGIESNALVEYSDILPTMIDAAGGEPVKKLDGSTLMPVLLKNKKKHKEYTYSLQTTRTIFNGAEYYPIRSISDGKYRLILNLTPNAVFRNTVTEKNKFFQEWKNSDNKTHLALAKRYQYRPGVELYDDEQDPYNMNNLAEDSHYKEKIRELRQKLWEWMSYCGDQGIQTELEANLHTNHRVNTKETVSMNLDFLPAKKEGNFKVDEDGYYFFYSKATISIDVDGNSISLGKTKNNEFANYGVFALKKGKHTINFDSDKHLDWSGPEMLRREFKL